MMLLLTAATTLLKRPPFISHLLQIPRSSSSLLFTRSISLTTFISASPSSKSSSIKRKNGSLDQFAIPSSYAAYRTSSYNLNSNNALNPDITNKKKENTAGKELEKKPAEGRKSIQGDVAPKISDREIFKIMYNYIWPKDEISLRARVAASLTFLVAGKVFLN